MAFVIGVAFGVNFRPPSRFDAGRAADFPFQASPAPRARAEGELALVMKDRARASAHSAHETRRAETRGSRLR